MSGLFQSADWAELPLQRHVLEDVKPERDRQQAKKSGVKDSLRRQSGIAAEPLGHHAATNGDRHCGDQNANHPWQDWDVNAN